MAKTVLHTYKNKEQLEQFLSGYTYFDSSHLVVQIISKNKEKCFFSELYDLIHAHLPNATVLGFSMEEADVEDVTQKEDIEMVFTQFNSAVIKSMALSETEFSSCELMGEYLNQHLINQETKALLIYSVNQTTGTEKIFSSYTHASTNLQMIGGVVTTKNHYSNEIAFLNGKFLKSGLIAITFSGFTLESYFYQTAEFDKFGPLLKITKAKNNIIYEINNKNAQQVLNDLLGYDKLDLTNELLYQFPVISNDKGEPLFITKLHANGAVELNHPIKEESLVTISIINYEKLINKAIKNIQKLSRQTIETIFTINCNKVNSIIKEFSTEQVENFQKNVTYDDSCKDNPHTKTKESKLAITYLGFAKNEMDQMEMVHRTFSFKIPLFYQTILSLVHLVKNYEKINKQMTEDLERNNTIYKNLFNKIDDLICSIDTQEVVLTINDTTLNQFSITRDQIIGKKLSDVLSEEYYLKITKYSQQAFKGKEQFFNLRMQVNEDLYHEYIIQQIPYVENGKVVKVFSIAKNITLLKEYEEEIVNLSQLDFNTGLPNKSTFIHLLNEKVELAKNKNSKLALLVVDMDSFKKINDHLGYIAGDAIIRQIARRIETSITSHYFLSRFNEDKFFLFTTKDIEEEQINKVASTILKDISQPIYYKGNEIYLTASIGVSLFPNDGNNSVYLIKNAEIAVDIAKFNGGNKTVFFSTQANKKYVERLEIEDELQMALSKEEFQIHYQPLIDMKTMQVISAEALLRWNNKKLGMVMPSQFIPIAERTGMINSIGKWVLYEACKQTKAWQLAGVDHMGISVNVSAIQFKQPSFIYHVESILEETGLDPKFLTLELTESTALEDINYSIESIKKLQQLGIRMAIDDFGTGYSSLSYLKNLPIDILKLDRSFIVELDRDTSDHAIVQAIIMITKGLKIKVLAEGVETKHQLELLNELNCDFAQGYYISRPVPKEEFSNKFF